MNRLLSHIIILSCIFYSIELLASTAYVSDTLSINMRKDKGIQFKILKILESGTAVQVIKQDSSGYTLVKTDNGATGWVLSRFLQNEPIAKTKLEKATQTISELKKINTKLNNELVELKKSFSTLSESEKHLTKDNNKYAEEVVRLRKIAARPMQLEKNNEKLRNELLANEANTRLLSQELQSYRDASEREWFITGSLVLFGGIVLGLIIPYMKTSRRRSQNWSRLN